MLLICRHPSERAAPPQEQRRFFDVGKLLYWSNYERSKDEY